MIRIVPLLLFFAIAVALLLGLQHQQTPAQTANPAAMDDTKKPWSPVAVTNAAGTSVTIDAKQLGGKVTVVNMFASWCEPCKAEMPELAKLHQSSHAQFYGIVWNDTPATMHDWLAQYGNPFDTVWYDDTGHAAITLGVRGVPESFVIDKHGMLRYRMTGAITPEFAQTQLLPLLKKLQAE